MTDIDARPTPVLPEVLEKRRAESEQHLECVKQLVERLRTETGSGWVLEVNYTSDEDFSAFAVYSVWRLWVHADEPHVFYAAIDVDEDREWDGTGTSPQIAMIVALTKAEKDLSHLQHFTKSAAFELRHFKETCNP